MRFRSLHALLLAYGLFNAVLYAALLPLWEGFDEEFHYGYVQHVGETHSLPVLGQTAISAEIDRSVALLPMSHVMIANMGIGGIRPFDQFFALDSAARHQLHDEAWQITPESHAGDAVVLGADYEVHHPPLAYIVMAVADQMRRGAPLPARVLMLRVLAGLAAMVLMFFGLERLGRVTESSQSVWAPLVFLVFSCQMFWATVAHVANDWLAVPLGVWLIAEAMRFDRTKSPGVGIGTAIILGLGLLSKAYFLVFVPLYIVAIVMWRKRRILSNSRVLALLAIPLVMAGPWYLRNILLYGNLSGRIEEHAGVGVMQSLRAMASIPWGHSLPFMLRGALWLGNASFTDFSVSTIDLVLALLAIGIVLYIVPIVRASKPERLREAAMLLLPVLLFGAAIIYVTGSSYAFTKGAQAIASTWYDQAVMPALLCAVLVGCQRSPRFGRWIASATVIIWAYVLTATYVAKLFPLYGGFPQGRSTLRAVIDWYRSDWPRTADILDTTALAPHSVLVTLLVGVLAAQVVLLCMLFRTIWRRTTAT